MTEAEQRGHYWAALLCAGIGLYLGYLAWSRQPGLRVPPGVGYLSAGAFLAAGAALVLQARRARKGHLVSVFLLVAALAGIGGWIGFGPGGRQCKGSLGILSFLASELVCRMAFGAGAVLTGVIAVLILRSLLKDKNARLLPGLALTFSAILPLPAQVQGESQVAAQIASLVARYDSGWNRRDTITVSRLLAPRYQYFTSRGGVSSRAETMGVLERTRLRAEAGQAVRALGGAERPGGRGKQPLARRRELPRRGLTSACSWRCFRSKERWINPLSAGRSA